MEEGRNTLEKVARKNLPFYHYFLRQQRRKKKRKKEKRKKEEIEKKKQMLCLMKNEPEKWRGILQRKVT